MLRKMALQWLLVAAVMIAAGCSDGSSDAGVGTVVVFNVTATTVEINYRFAVPAEWKSHSLWLWPEGKGPRLDRNSSWWKREANETYDFQVVVNSRTYDHYDAVVVDEGFSTYVFIQEDGTIAVTRHQPYR